VEDLKIGAVVRSVRRRRGLRQRDVAALAGVSQWAVSQVERGQLELLRVRIVRRICAALEIRMSFDPRWRGGQLDRIADSRHAALVEEVVARLAPLGWEIVVEYTFSRYREQGAVDVLAWRDAERALLLVEVKTELDNLQSLLSVLDRKRRIVPGLVAVERGWRAAVLGTILVAPEGSTFRDGVARHQATFGAALPHRNVDVKRWIGQPVRASPLRGIWFLRASGPGILMEGRGGPSRIRTGRKPSLTAATARSAHDSRSA
jgi:transcriptional regulator with XRE-family HTH domain